MLTLSLTLRSKLSFNKQITATLLNKMFMYINSLILYNNFNNKYQKTSLNNLNIFKCLKYYIK
jgi:hypothetical protein